MRHISASVAFILVMSGSAALADVDLTFTRADGHTELLPNNDDPAHALWADQINTIELWLTNDSAATSALSAYQFNFEAGDYVDGKLDASNWLQSSAFDGLDPAWTPNDLTLDTAGADWWVSGVTGSLSTPFVGPELPVGTPVLIGTFNVYVNAASGELVDALLGADSEIDDQMGNLPTITSFGVEDVLVIVPEPSSLTLLAVASLALLRSRR